MPLLENLAEGFANAAGATGAAQGIEKQKAQRQTQSHEALEDTIQAHIDVMKGLQAKLGQNPNDPQLTQQLSGERDQLFQLLHSTEQTKPGLVQKLFRHVFRGKDQGQQQQPVNNLPSVANMAAAAPKPPEDPNSGLSPADVIRKHRIAAGLDPRATAEKETPTKYQPQLTTTTDAAGKTHYWRVPLEEGGKPEEVDFNGQTVAPKGNSAPKIGSFGDFMVQMYGPHPTGKQYQQGRQLWQPISETAGIHTVMMPQPDGKIVPVQVEVISEHGPAGRVSVPKPPGEQKKDLAGMTKSTGGVVGVGDAIGGKRTPDQNKASNDVVEATKLSDLADQVAKKPDDAVNVHGFAIALEKARSGRYTTQALDKMLEAGWGNKIDQWALNPTTGSYPADIIRQLVDGAHENLHAAQAAKEAAFKPSSSSGDVSDDDIIKALQKK